MYPGSSRGPSASSRPVSLSSELPRCHLARLAAEVLAPKRSPTALRPPKLTCQALFALHAGPSDDARANGILTAMVPLAIATELAEDLQLADGLDEDPLQMTRAEVHLARLKQALLLYVNAKFIEHVSYTSLKPKLMKLGVGSRSVNGAWAIVRDTLKGLAMTRDEALEI